MTLRNLLRRASEQISQDLEDRRNARVRLLGRLEKTLVDQGVKVTLDPESEVLRLPESLLFEVGQSTLDGQAGMAALDKVSLALADVLPCYVASEVQPKCESRDSGTLEGVLVEGHSDRAGYSEGGRKLNEEESRDRNDHLSMERALTVFKEMLQRKKLDQIKNNNGFSVLGVSAYGARRPIRRAAVRMIISRTDASIYVSCYPNASRRCFKNLSMISRRSVTHHDRKCRGAERVKKSACEPAGGDQICP